MIHLKTPPYGKPLADLIHSGFKPNNSVYVFIGQQAWHMGRARSISNPCNVLVLPAYHCPTAYQWPVYQCDILIIDTGYPEIEYIEDLVFCLYSYGALVVRYLSPDLKLTIF